MSKEIRENNLDILRIIAAIMVIIQHVLAIYIFRTRDNLPGYATTANLFMSLSVFAVPIFVMLSGAFLLDDNKNKHYYKFYKKTINRIIIPMIIWSLLYFLYTMLKTLIAFKSGQDVSFSEPVINLINGRPYYHIWYLYMVTGLYIIVPILIRLKEDIGEVKFFYVGIVSLLLGIVIYFTCNLFWILWFTEYLGYFILGYSIRKIYEKIYIKPILPILITLSCSILIFILKEKNILSKYLDVYRNLTPLVIIGSIAIYIAFLNMKRIKLNCNALVANCFNIYLIHHGLLDVLGIIQGKITVRKLNPILYIPIMTIIVFILSYLISLIINKSIKLISNRVKNDINIESF